MSNDVAAFVAWAEKLAVRVRSSVTVNVAHSPHSANPSAFVDFESFDSFMGRLHFHERGGATADLFDGNGEQIDLTSEVQKVGGWDEVESHRFCAAFSPFTTYFLRNGIAG